MDPWFNKKFCDRFLVVRMLTLFFEAVKTQGTGIKSAH